MQSKRPHNDCARIFIWTVLLELLSDKPQKKQSNCAESNPCKRAPAYAKFKRFAKSPESEPFPQKAVFGMWEWGRR
jgi:hypothetical protein